MHKFKNNNEKEEWAEIDLADLGLEDPLGQAVDENGEQQDVMVRDITPNTVQKAFVEDGVEPENTEGEVAPGWPKFVPTSNKYAATTPHRPYAYQAARSDVSLEDQKEIEAVVFDTPNGETFVPCKSVLARQPTEEQAARRDQPNPPQSTVMNISEEAKMKTLAAMEIAMGNYLGIPPGMGGLGALGKKKGGIFKKVSKVAKKAFIPNIVNAVAKKNPAFNVVNRILNPAQHVVEGVSSLANKKRKAANKKAAQKTAAAKAAALAARQEEKTAKEIAENATINYKMVDKFVKDRSGNVIKKQVKVPETVNIFVPDHGNITIPWKLYNETTPKSAIYTAAVEYKTAQEAQSQLAAEETEFAQAATAMSDIAELKEEELKAVENPAYVPSTPVARTAPEVVADNAEFAVNYMQNNQIPATQTNITQVAQATTDAWLAQQRAEIERMRQATELLKQQQEAAAIAQRQMASYVQYQGGIPEPAKTPPYYAYEEAADDEIARVYEQAERIQRVEREYEEESYGGEDWE